MEEDKKSQEKSKEEEEKLIESYEIDSDGVKTRVNIIEKDYIPFYKLIIPEVDIATKALLDDIKERLIGAVDMSVSDVLDPKLMSELKKEFKKDADALLTKELPKLDQAVKDHFILNLIHELLGLGDMEFFLDDNYIEEV
ncbi:MAG TPA: hypothetical protein ENG20_02845, partial [Methanomicrobia archaeon]|nr:hypothetical protein [Methanomicrobia archaeon]